MKIDNDSSIISLQRLKQLERYEENYIKIEKELKEEKQKRTFIIKDDIHWRNYKFIEYGDEVKFNKEIEKILNEKIEKTKQMLYKYEYLYEMYRKMNIFSFIKWKYFRNKEE